MQVAAGIDSVAALDLFQNENNVSPKLDLNGPKPQMFSMPNPQVSLPFTSFLQR